VTGQLEVVIDEDEWSFRTAAEEPKPPYDTGRELFALMRGTCDEAERGASAMLAAMDSEIGLMAEIVAVDVGGAMRAFAGRRSEPMACRDWRRA
jgi:hypothetical protein